MAGLGFKDFQVGEVLTSSDVDGYLMQQTVMRFADSAARGSALGTATGTAVPLAEGMVTYLDDLNALQVYTGTSWRDPSIGIGTNAVQTVKVDSFSTTSTTFVDVTGLSVTITPTSVSSKVLVLAYVPISASGTSENRLVIRRDSTDLNVTSDGSNYHVNAGNSVANREVVHYFSAVLLDSPATTSATTYKIRARTSASTLYVGRIAAASFLSISSLAAIEVAS